MKITEAGLLKHIEFKTEEEKEEYLNGLDRMEIEHCVITDGISYGDNGTVWFVDIVERDLRFPYPLFNAERWL